MSSFKVFDELLTCYSSRLQGPEMRLFRIKGVAVKLNDTMKKVHKSKMIEKLHTEPMEAVPDKYIALVDVGFLWCLATPSSEDRKKPDGSVFTSGDYADKLFSIALVRHPRASQIVFVNDPYDLEFTTKDSEHDRRQSS